MRNKQVLVYLCAAAMAVSSLAGCKQTAQEETQTEQAAQQELQTVRVTAVDGMKITAMVETRMGGAPDGEIPDGAQPDGEQPDGEQPNGERPDGEQPNGERPDGEQPGGEKPDGEKPDGEQPGGEMPDGEKPGEASGEEITFTVTDETEIRKQDGDTDAEGSMDDITVGSMLEITLDDENNALTIVIRGDNPGGFGGFGGSDEVTNGTSANTIEEDIQIQGESYSSDGDDENALRIDGAEVTLSDITVEKSGGESSNTENGDFYGQNAALLALNGAQVTIDGAQVKTSAANGNGVFSYGSGTVVNISNSVIYTTGNNSGGIQTTGGGTTNATNLEIDTQGNSSAAIRSDRGGGTVNVDGGTYTTSGTGSPAVYCTADISVSNAVLTANASEGVVVEGRNSVSLKDCQVTSTMSNTYQGDEDENIHCIMIYQSMSGDAEVGEASFTVEGGSITAKEGDMFYVTNTDCVISLKQVNFTLANDVFLRVEGNTSSRGWGRQGENGGTVTLTAQEQEISGNILVDSISGLELTLEKGSAFSGAINPEGGTGTVNVTLDKNSVWNLTGDSYVSSFDGDVSQVTANGYHLYVDGEKIL
jgi:hypothetical protein